MYDGNPGVNLLSPDTPPPPHLPLPICLVGGRGGAKIPTEGSDWSGCSCRSHGVSTLGSPTVGSIYSSILYPPSTHPTSYTRYGGKAVFPFTGMGLSYFSYSMIRIKTRCC